MIRMLPPPPGSRRLDGVRITSNNVYTDSMIVFDPQHMPWGCAQVRVQQRILAHLISSVRFLPANNAQWPSFWTLTNQNWPDGGEVDIIESMCVQSHYLLPSHRTFRPLIYQFARHRPGFTTHKGRCPTIGNKQGERFPLFDFYAYSPNTYIMTHTPPCSQTIATQDTGPTSTQPITTDLDSTGRAAASLSSRNGMLKE